MKRKIETFFLIWLKRRERLFFLTRIAAIVGIIAFALAFVLYADHPSPVAVVAVFSAAIVFTTGIIEFSVNDDRPVNSDLLEKMTKAALRRGYTVEDVVRFFASVKRIENVILYREIRYGSHNRRR